MAIRPAVSSAGGGGMLSRIPVLVEMLENEKVDPLHWHNFTQIWYVLRGRLTHNIDNEVYEQRAGELAIVLPYTMHSICSHDEGDGVYIASLSYDDIFFANRGYSIFSYFRERAFFEGFKIPVYTVLSEGEKAHADVVVNAMIAEFSRHRHMSFEILAQYLAELLNIVCVEPADKIKGLSTIISHTESVTEVIAYMSNNLERNFTLDELCTRSCMSRSAFTKHFKAVTGMTSKDFVLALRLSRATMMILYTDKTLDEISREIGFYDSSYLTRMFTERFGISPKRYREKYIKSAYEQDDVFYKRWAWYFEDEGGYTRGMLGVKR